MVKSAMARWLVGTSGYVYFNNDGRAAAVRSARRLIELLEARPGRRRAA